MATDIVAIVSVIGATVTSILGQLQNSKCTRIDFCGITCDRSVAENEERGIPNVSK